MNPRPFLGLALLGCFFATNQAAPLKVTPTANEVAARIEQLGSDETAERRAAADWLGRAGESASASVPVLIKALEDRDDLVRRNAAWALGKIKAPADLIVPALIARLRSIDEDWTVRHNAMLSLSWIGAPSVSALRTLLDAPHAWSRAGAADALLRIEGAAVPRQILPVLDALLSDSDISLRALAANLTGRLRSAGAPLAPRLVTLLDETEQSPRLNAIKALRELGPLPVALQARIKQTMQEDSDPWVRIGAVQVLVEAFRSHDQTIELLIGAFSDPKDRVGLYAVQALASLGEAAVPALCATLKSDDRRLRLRAAETLAFMGPRAGQTADAATGALTAVLARDADWEVRSLAAAAIGAMGRAKPDTIVALEEARTDAHEIVRLNATDALAKLRQTDAVRALTPPAPTPAARPGRREV